MNNAMNLALRNQDNEHEDDENHWEVPDPFLQALESNIKAYYL